MRTVKDQRNLKSRPLRKAVPLLGYLPYLYVLVLLPCLLYTIFYTARAIRLDYTPVPFWDSWRSVQYLDSLLKFDLSHFWVQHNEHRIVFPEMIFALDYIFLRGRQVLPIACNIACQLVQFTLLCRLIQQMKDMPPAFRLTLAAGCGLCMFSALQVQGILGTFLIVWYLGLTAAALSLLLLYLCARSGRLTALILSVTAAVVATYTAVNGMLLWPILVTMAALLRVSRRRIAVIAVAGVLSIAIYFAGYTSMSHGRTLVLLAHPVYALWFVSVLLGTPVSLVHTEAGGAAGLSGLLLLSLAILIALRQKCEADPVFVVTTGMCLFIAASALLTAYGRMDPADTTVNAAKAARYISVPLTYWANLAVAAAWLARRLPRGRRLAFEVAAALLAILILAAVMRIQKPYERSFAAIQARGHQTGIALEAGIQDARLIHVIFPDPQFVRTRTPAIRAKRLSIFADGRQDWIGQPVSRVFKPGPGLCGGAMESRASVDGGYRVTGWAMNQKLHRPAKDIVLANAAGTIMGFGETRPGGYPSDDFDPAPRPPSDFDWVAFARSDHTSETVQAYAIVDSGQRACALGSPQ